jgi:hypothetical protein
MSSGQRHQPEQEIARGVVLNEVVGQDAGRLVAIDFAASARPQMPDKAAQRRGFADELAVRPPGNEVDVNIGCVRARRRPRRATRVDLGDCADPAAGEKREESLSEAVPRRSEDREGASPEQLAQSFPAGGKIGGDGSS